VDSRIVVELCDALEKFSFGDVFREVDAFAVNVGL
jgi:hypothetical protein